MIPSGGDLGEALAFFVDHMGFEVTWQDDTMAGIAREDIAFNVVHNTNREWADNASFGIIVTDLAGLHRKYARLPATVGPLEVKPWGRLEFHVILPSGVCFQFYEEEE